MDEASITRYIMETFPDVEMIENYGYTMFFYKTDHSVAFATLISADYDYDRYSNLDRPGVFRLNLGIRKQSFQALFGTEKIDTSRYDYTALNTIMPHPEYAPQSYVCVLNPVGATAKEAEKLLAEAYGLAVSRYNRRLPD